MSLNTNQLRYIIKDVLEGVGLYSAHAEELLMLTAAQESHLGTYIKQMGDGPARGIFQMEKATERDIHSNFLEYREALANRVYGYMTLRGNDLRDNLAYQIIMARLHYLRVKEGLPKADDVEGLAAYWKKYYNTEAGKGTVEEAVENYERYCL